MHGRHDMGCPFQTAWPGARLRIIEDAGHAGSDTAGEGLREAIEEFKNR